MKNDTCKSPFLTFEGPFVFEKDLLLVLPGDMGGEVAGASKLASKMLKMSKGISSFPAISFMKSSGNSKCPEKSGASGCRGFALT